MQKKKQVVCSFFFLHLNISIQVRIKITLVCLLQINWLLKQQKQFNKEQRVISSFLLSFD